ncbi:MAG: hypothetical protein J5668_00980 [Bacteroidales bacterium]|nr:hypothetical protein [Bacteroidales bacterium]
MSKLLKIMVLSLALILASEAVSEAGKPRFRYGMEWGYSAKVASGFEYTIYNSYGSRISDSQPLSADYYTNAFVSADIGLEFLNYLAVSLEAGYRGVARDYRVMPLSLRLALFPKGYDKTGPFVFAGGGMALYNWSLEDKVNLISAGAGSRYNLSRKISLDGFLRANLISCSPLPVDPYEGTVPREKTVYSRTSHITMDLGIALYF